MAIISNELREAKLDAIEGILQEDVKGVIISYDEERKVFYTEWIIMEGEEYNVWWDV